MISICVYLFLILASAARSKGDYEEEHACYCKPKTVLKYVVVEVPKYVPVKKTKYVHVKEGTYQEHRRRR